MKWLCEEGLLPPLNGGIVTVIPRQSVTVANRQESRREERDMNITMLTARYFIGSSASLASRFWQCRPDPANPKQRIKGIDGVKNVPFMLPELIADSARQDDLHCRRRTKGPPAKGPRICRHLLQGWRRQVAQTSSTNTLRTPMSSSCPTMMTTDAITPLTLPRSLRVTRSRSSSVELPGLSHKGDIVNWSRQRRHCRGAGAPRR